MRALARRLDTGAPVSRCRRAGSIPGSRPTRSVDEMAAAYVDEIRAVQPGRPVRARRLLVRRPGRVRDGPSAGCLRRRDRVPRAHRHVRARALPLRAAIAAGLAISRPFWLAVNGVRDPRNEAAEPRPPVGGPPGRPADRRDVGAAVAPLRRAGQHAGLRDPLPRTDRRAGPVHQGPRTGAASVQPAPRAVEGGAGRPHRGDRPRWPLRADRAIRTWIGWPSCSEQSSTPAAGDA